MRRYGETKTEMIVVQDEYMGEDHIFENTAAVEDWLKTEFEPEELERRIGEMKFYELGPRIYGPIVKVQFSWD